MFASSSTTRTRGSGSGVLLLRIVSHSQCNARISGQKRGISLPPFLHNSAIVRSQTPRLLEISMKWRVVHGGGCLWRLAGRTVRAIYAWRADDAPQVVTDAVTRGAIVAVHQCQWDGRGRDDRPGRLADLRKRPGSLCGLQLGREEGADRRAARSVASCRRTSIRRGRPSSAPKPKSSGCGGASSTRRRKRIARVSSPTGS